MLDELRVVDALIAAPRHVELPENFTFATMAEVRSLPRPHALKVHPCSSIGRRSPYEYPNEGVGSTEEVAASGRSP